MDNLKEFNKLSNKIEYSYLWLKKYSKLRNNDKIILCVSTIEQLEYNLNVYNKNFSLNEQTLSILNKIYDSNNCPDYYY